MYPRAKPSPEDKAFSDVSGGKMWRAVGKNLMCGEGLRNMVCGWGKQGVTGGGGQKCYLFALLIYKCCKISSPWITWVIMGGKSREICFLSWSITNLRILNFKPLNQSVFFSAYWRISAFLRWFLSTLLPEISPKIWQILSKKAISAPPTDCQNTPCQLSNIFFLWILPVPIEEEPGSYTHSPGASVCSQSSHKDTECPGRPRCLAHWIRSCGKLTSTGPCLVIKSRNGCDIKEVWWLWKKNWPKISQKSVSYQKKDGHIILWY